MDKERVTPVIDQAKSCKSVDLPFAIPAAASLVVSVSLCFWWIENPACLSACGF
jgi:hypothetical protein